MPGRPCVLVFAGADPSGGAGIAADIQAIAALGSHALPVITVLTVQDNDRVFSVHPVDAQLVRQQTQAVIDKIDIAAVKIGIVGSAANAEVIAEMIRALRQNNPDLPVVFDPVLASGHGDALSVDNAVQMLEPLFSLATLIVPNLPEASALCGTVFSPLSRLRERVGVRGAVNAQAKHEHSASLLDESKESSLQAPLPPTRLSQAGEGGTCVTALDALMPLVEEQAECLIAFGCQNVLIKGGHGAGSEVVNSWFTKDAMPDAKESWHWPRLQGQFHGSGCTLASAIAAKLAQGHSMRQAIATGQAYCQQTLTQAFRIADGQSIPNRDKNSDSAFFERIQ